MTYRVGPERQLTWTAEAVTDAPTIVNLVHHPYWNLSEGMSANIDEHILQLFAESYLPVADGKIPTGEIRPVDGTLMDFRRPRVMRKEAGLDYDHCWVLDRSAAADDLVLAARLSDPRSGRMLEVSTNQPGIHFCDWSVMDGSVIGRSGQNYGPALVSASNRKTFPTRPTIQTFPLAALNPDKFTRALSPMDFAPNEAQRRCKAQGAVRSLVKNKPDTPEM